jgi:hypothetical protein
MKNDINQKINHIINGDPYHYRMELFYLKSSKDLSDDERTVITQYYYIVRALSHVAKKRYKYQFDLLLKNHTPLFWKPDSNMLDKDWFADGLLEVTSLIRQHIRELHFELSGLEEGNYGGIKRIELYIEDYKLYIDYLLNVHDYTQSQEWRYDEYLQINVYEYNIHTLEIVKQLEENGITIESIIDDINRKRSVFYCIAIFWYLGAIKRVIEDTGKAKDNPLSLILRKWFVADVPNNTIAKYLAYLRNHDNSTLTNTDSGYETIISEIKEKYFK